jgi:PAS domain S-box-containing protein
MGHSLEGLEGKAGGMVDSADPRHEKAWREWAERFHLMVEAVGDGLTLIDGGRVVFVNDRLCQILGHSKRELARMGDLDLAAPEERDRLLQSARKAQERGLDLKELEFWAVRKDGSRCYIRNRYSVVAVKRGVRRRIVITTDLTEQRLAQQEQERLREHRRRQMQIGARIAQEVASVSSLDELYHRLVWLVKERFDYYHVQIFCPDPELRAMTLVEGYGKAGERMKAAGHKLLFGLGVVGAAAVTGEPVLASDLAHDSFWVPHFELPETKGELAVPIKVLDSVRAVLDVVSDRAGALTEEDKSWLQSLAWQVSIVLQSQHQLEGAQARARREQVLHEISAKLPSFSDPDTLAQTVVRELGTSLGRPVLIRLGSAEDLSRAPNVPDAGDGDREAGGTGTRRPGPADPPVIEPAEGGE